MTETYLTIETVRSCYGLCQLGKTMTVGELIDLLSEYDEDMPVAFSNDNGYTYGELRWSAFEEKEDDSDKF